MQLNTKLLSFLVYFFFEFVCRQTMSMQLFGNRSFLILVACKQMITWTRDKLMTPVRKMRDLFFFDTQQTIDPEKTDTRREEEANADVAIAMGGVI